MIDSKTWLAHVCAHAYPNLTAWFCCDVAPARPGYYERYYTDGIHRHFWDGKFWKASPMSAPHWRQVGDYPAWRGLAAPATLQGKI